MVSLFILVFGYTVNVLYDDSTGQGNWTGYDANTSVTEETVSGAGAYGTDKYLKATMSGPSSAWTWYGFKWTDATGFSMDKDDILRFNLKWDSLTMSGDSGEAATLEIMLNNSYPNYLIELWAVIYPNYSPDNPGTSDGWATFEIPGTAFGIGASSLTVTQINICVTFNTDNDSLVLYLDEVEVWKGASNTEFLGTFDSGESAFHYQKTDTAQQHATSSEYLFGKGSLKVVHDGAGYGDGGKYHWNGSLADWSSMNYIVFWVKNDSANPCSIGYLYLYDDGDENGTEDAWYYTISFPGSGDPLWKQQVASLGDGSSNPGDFNDPGWDSDDGLGTTAIDKNKIFGICPYNDDSNTTFYVDEIRVTGQASLCTFAAMGYDNGTNRLWVQDDGTNLLDISAKAKVAFQLRDTSTNAWYILEADSYSSGKAYADVSSLPAGTYEVWVDGIASNGNIYVQTQFPSTVTIGGAGNSPAVLSLVDESPYWDCETAVYPATVCSLSEEVTFKFVYKDLDNDPPSDGYPKILIDDDTTFGEATETGEPEVVLVATGSDTDYSSGVVFSKSLTLGDLGWSDIPRKIYYKIIAKDTGSGVETVLDFKSASSSHDDPNDNPDMGTPDDDARSQIDHILYMPSPLTVNSMDEVGTTVVVSTYNATGNATVTNTGIVDGKGVLLEVDSIDADWGNVTLGISVVENFHSSGLKLRFWARRLTEETSAIIYLGIQDSTQTTRGEFFYSESGGSPTVGELFPEENKWYLFEIPLNSSMWHFSDWDDSNPNGDDVLPIHSLDKILISVTSSTATVFTSPVKLEFDSFSVVPEGMEVVEPGYDNEYFSSSKVVKGFPVEFKAIVNLPLSCVRQAVLEFEDGSSYSLEIVEEDEQLFVYKKIFSLGEGKHSARLEILGDEFRYLTYVGSVEVVTSTKTVVAPTPVSTKAGRAVIAGVPSSAAKIILVDIRGIKVAEIRPQETYAEWNLKNSAGRIVKPGVYIYVVLDDKNKVLTKGRIIVKK